MNSRNDAARDEIAKFIRHLRTIKTVALTIREKNAAIRSHARNLERLLNSPTDRSN